MSAVPNNILDFSSVSAFGDGYAYDPSVMGWGFTQATDYGTTPLSDGIPDNVVNTERSDGITWSGALGGALATANAIGDVFGKVYQLNSSVENAKFQRDVQAAQLQLQRDISLGNIDVQKARNNASIAIEKSKAQRATNDSIAQQKSGASGYVVSKVSQNKSMLLIGGVVIIGAALFMWGKK